MTDFYTTDDVWEFCPTCGCPMDKTKPGECFNCYRTALENVSKSEQRSKILRCILCGSPIGEPLDCCPICTKNPEKVKGFFSGIEESMASLDPVQVLINEQKEKETSMKHRNTHDEFETGAHRDDSSGKGQLSLLSPVALYRDALLLEEGAKHYDSRNWEKGMPFCRTLDSVLRHVFQYLAGMDDEDHLAAARFGLAALMHYEAGIASGSLPASLDDRPKTQKKILETFLTSLESAATLEKEPEAQRDDRAAAGVVFIPDALKPDWLRAEKAAKKRHQAFLDSMQSLPPLVPKMTNIAEDSPESPVPGDDKWADHIAAAKATFILGIPGQVKLTGLVEDLSGFDLALDV